MKFVYLKNNEEYNVDIEKEIIRIGRDPNNDIHLSTCEDSYHGGVSRFHALFYVGIKVLVDNDSRNGIYVQGEKINGGRKLDHFDSVSLGRKASLCFYDY
jgi:pSer/pThr/pTyr-binding forkhead associated (FHA) protein